MHVGQGRSRDGRRGDGPATPRDLSDRPEARVRQLKGAAAYHGGRVAEEQVATHYQRRGCVVAARRWRGQAGEIDLIMRDGPLLIFVEVKHAESFAVAAERISSQQLSRIMAAASEFVAQEPAGQDSEMRFDAALVDRHGQIEIRENMIGW